MLLNRFSALVVVLAFVSSCSRESGQLNPWYTLEVTQQPSKIVTLIGRAESRFGEWELASDSRSDKIIYHFDRKGRIKEFRKTDGFKEELELVEKVYHNENSVINKRYNGDGELVSTTNMQKGPLPWLSVTRDSEGTLVRKVSWTQVEQGKPVSGSVTSYENGEAYSTNVIETKISETGLIESQANTFKDIEGNVTTVVIEEYNDSGWLKVRKINRGEYEHITKYEYLESDDIGSWTKRLELKYDELSENPDEEPDYWLSLREISYSE